jgi:hypothetical protein
MVKTSDHRLSIEAWELDKICKRSETVMSDHMVFWLKMGTSGDLL